MEVEHDRHRLVGFVLWRDVDSEWSRCEVVVDRPKFRSSDGIKPFTVVCFVGCVFGLWFWGWLGGRLFGDGFIGISHVFFGCGCVLIVLRWLFLCGGFFLLFALSRALFCLLLGDDWICTGDGYAKEKEETKHERYATGH